MYSELWKETQYKGYHVSSFGRVWSDYSNREVGFKQNSGYRAVCINDKWVRIHTLVLETFVRTKPSPRHECRHLNGVRNDNYVDNLAWGTRKDNVADAKRHGTLPKGETQGTAKLTKQEVINIRYLYAEQKYTQTELAKKYNITHSSVSSIVHGKTWKHVSGPVVPKKKRSTPIEDVQEIRHKYENENYTRKQLAKEYNLDSGTISRMVNYKTYKNV